MRIIESASELAGFSQGVFVPTMGALHEGHASLVRQARAIADGRRSGAAVVVSVFVNPTQFNDPSDLARYPRTLDTDAKLCEAAGADAVFVPSVEAVYPSDGSTKVPELPTQATQPRLEDAHRPGHFAGVCQVVKRLFELVRPAAAIFGEKDWQQLQVIRAISAGSGLDRPVEIVPGPIVREADGLAMSSRNRFLTPDERVRAVGMIAALRAAREHGTIPDAERTMVRVLREHRIEPQYAVVREAETLNAVSETSPGVPYRALIAGKLGGVRLLDNISWSANL